TELLPVSRRRRQPAAPTSRNTSKETALPTDAIAERSTKLATSSTSTAEMSSPACGPSRDFDPKEAGNSPASASQSATFAEAQRLAFAPPGVESRAATAMTVKPASPSVGRAASAIAVSPYFTTSATVSVPNTPSAISTYTVLVTPIEPNSALGT